MDAIAYIRISTKDQSTYSLDYQERIVKQYCKDNKLTLLELFKDNGESSYTFDRPDWKELEKFIRKNKSVQYLIIFDHDRFSRNLAEALLKIKELQDKFNIKVLATTDRIDTDMSDPSTYIMRAFKFMMAESELMRLRERIKNGMMQAAMSGYHANKAPYGFLNTKTPDGKPLLIPDPEKSKFVKQIFKLHLEGKSPEQIRSILKPQGYKQTGNSAIQNILSNPVYAGFIKVPKYKDRPEYLTKGHHKGLISEDIYWMVQNKGKSINIQNKDEVPLRGVLKCWCGKPVTAGNSKGRNKYYWYYLCSEHRENLSAVKLHDKLNKIFMHLSFTPDQIEMFRDRLAYKIGAMMQSRAEDIGAVSKDLEVVKKKIISTEEKYLLNQDISPETFKKVIGELKVQKINLEKKINELSATSKDYMNHLEYMLPKLADLGTAYETISLEGKQAFVKLVFGDSLNYTGESYRTTFLHPLFEHNELILKENGLLIKEQPVIKIGKSATSTGNRNAIESFEQLYELFKAV